MPQNVNITEFAKGVVLNEGDVEVTGANYTIWDYRGKSPVDVPALHLTLVDSDGEEYDNYYSAGKIDDFAPSEDGKSLIVLGSKVKVHEQSNFAMFINNLIIAGFPKKQIDSDDIGCLVGIKGHMTTLAIKRTGEGVKGDGAILIFDRIDTLPGAKSSGKRSGKKAQPDEDTTSIATSILTSILKVEGELARKSLMGKVIGSPDLKALPQSDRTKVINTLKDETFLTIQDGWVYAEGILTLAQP